MPRMSAGERAQYREPGRHFSEVHERHRVDAAEVVSDALAIRKAGHGAPGFEFDQPCPQAARVGDHPPEQVREQHPAPRYGAEVFP